MIQVFILQLIGMLSSTSCVGLGWVHILKLTLLVSDLTSISLLFVAVLFLPTIKHHHAKIFKRPRQCSLDPNTSYICLHKYPFDVFRPMSYHHNLYNMPPRSIPLQFSRMHPWHDTPLTLSSPHPPTPRNPPQLLSPSHALKHTLFHLSMVLTLIATLLLLLSLSPYSQALDAPYTDPKSKTCSAPLLRKEWYSLPLPALTKKYY
jgi:hypothetical protein